MSGKYDAAREAFGEGSLSWTEHKIVAQLVTRNYTFDPKDKTLRGAVGAPLVLTGKSITGGWARCGNMVFLQVPGDGKSEVVAIVIRREASADKPATLIAYLDDIEKFPMRANGGDIVVDVPAQGLFRV